MTKRWSSTKSLDGQTKRQASKQARREHKIGGYVADYSPLTPEEIAAPDPALDDLYRNSVKVSDQ